MLSGKHTCSQTSHTHSPHNAHRTIFNGNGKLPWELELAVEQGVLINIDSEFDFDNIKAAAKKVNKPAKTLLRINPDVDPEVCVCVVCA